MLWKHHEKYAKRLNISLLYIGSASHKIGRILKEVGIQVYHSSENKLFRSLCTHNDRVNEFQKPVVNRIPCECGLVYIGLKNIEVIKREPISKSQLCLNSWTNDYRIK